MTSPSSRHVATVTGAAGFLGGHVIPALRADGWHVRALTRQPDKVVADEVYPWNGFGDHDSLRDALRGATTVVHLAANAHALDARKQRLESMRRDNVDVTRSIAVASREAGVRRLILVSSIAARGPSPSDHYGQSKAESERVALVAGDGVMEVVVVRPPMVYGEGMKGRPLTLFRYIATGRPIPIVRTRNARSIAYAGNVAASLVYFARASTAVPGKHAYPADERSVSTEELVRAIGDALGVRPRLVRVPSVLVYVAGAIGSLTCRKLVPANLEDVRRALGTMTVDPASMRVAFENGSPPFSTTEGLARSAEWFRKTSK